MPSDEDEEASGDALWDDEQAAKVSSSSHTFSTTGMDYVCMLLQSVCAIISRAALLSMSLPLFDPLCIGVSEYANTR